MSDIHERAIDAAPEAIKLRDTIRHAIMPLLDEKSMGVISAALSANFIAFCVRSFRHKLVFDRSSLTRWRKRMGEAAAGAVAGKPSVAVKTDAIKPCERGVRLRTVTPCACELVAMSRKAAATAKIFTGFLLNTFSRCGKRNRRGCLATSPSANGDHHVLFCDGIR